LGHGRAFSREAWDQQYRTGAWDYLNSLQELDHYSIIVGYIRHFFEWPEILDVGCGQGRLLSLLHPASLKRYTGVDFSPEAISRARQLKISNASFVTENFEEWIPSDSVDLIIISSFQVLIEGVLSLISCRCHVRFR